MPTPTINNTNPSLYSLKTTDGVQIEAVVDPTNFVVKCQSNPPGISLKRWKRIHREFLPWLSTIFGDSGIDPAKAILLSGEQGRLNRYRFQPLTEKGSK